jgi:hypothetical protein
MEDADDQESNYSESSEEEAVVDSNIAHDMEKLANTYPGFRHRYRLIKRIGEGRLPSVNRKAALLTRRRHVLYRLQGRGPAVRPVRQLVGLGQGE